MGEDGLPHGALGNSSLHVCVDMQRLFAEQTDWHTPWMMRIVPQIARLAASRPTIFTRFIPADRPGEGEGNWRRYYERWASMTIERLGAPMIELVPELASLVPPGEVVDKRVYSPWVDNTLQDRLVARGIDTLVVSGGETDVCVLATVMGAIDRGYRVVIVTDGLCSSSDETHDALLRLYFGRFGQQVETATTEQILANWPESG